MYYIVGRNESWKLEVPRDAIEAIAGEAGVR